MADDRLESPTCPLTHQFRPSMLGVHRPGVTIAVQDFEREGVITRKRGRIVITDRKALKKLSNGTYAPPTTDNSAPGSKTSSICHCPTIGSGRTPLTSPARPRHVKRKLAGQMSWP